MSTLHVGDTAPPFTADLATGGAPVNLTGATIALHFRKPDGTVLTLPATADTPTTGGKVTGGAWGTGLDTAGGWTVEAQVTYSDGKIQTFGPKRFTVLPQIA